MNNYLLRHVQTFFGALGQMARTPLTTLLTLAVLGITLALPAGLYVAVSSVERLGASLERGGQISLFLKRDTSDAAALKLAQQIRAMSPVAAVDYLSRADALAEFKSLSGFGPALTALGSNPLPSVLIVRPATDATPAAAEALREQLARLPAVELAELDLAWLRRLDAILAFGERAAWVLSVLLALAVLLIVGNTTRLAVLNRQAEIEVIQLVGGTPAFIRRPFLYTGGLQGLLGGLLAWLMVEVSLWIVAGPAQQLAGLYGSLFALTGLDLESGLALAGAGAILGWLGARLAVGWQLRRIAIQ
jgi:cell division transport system permease protein